MEKDTNEILFKNTSKMDMEEITMFQNTVMKKTIFVTSIIFALIFAGIVVGVSFWDLTLGIIVVVCGIVGGFLFIPYLMKETQKKQNQTNFGDKKYLNTYELYGDYMTVTTQCAKPDAKNEYEEMDSQKLYYVDIYQVVVYHERLFIFINPRQSFIFNFKGMTKGTAGEVVELFKKNNVKIKNK